MYTAKVQFETVVDAKAFVSICNEMDFKVELTSGPYIIDAKSIMGIFSLDLSKPLELRINSSDANEVDAVRQKISKFIIKD